MYSFKEKNKLYYDLQNVDHADADLCLLCAANPSDSIIDRAKRNPQRAHKEVLYRLLDLKTAEEIRINRRASFSAAEKEAVAKLAEETAAAKLAEETAIAEAAAKLADEPADTDLDLTAKAEELDSKEQDLNDKEIELEDKEIELSEKEDELAEKELELKNQAKEADKKKAPVSKKKTSTPKSIGKKSSPVKTSKQRP